MSSLSVPGPSAAFDRRRWWGLGVLAVAQLMLMLDTTVVNLALAPLEEDLHVTHVGLSWVVNGYTLPFGGLLLLGGRIGDALGRRRVFLVGLAVFAVASAIGGLATSPFTLVLSRVLQDVGGALVAPTAVTGLLLLTAAFVLFAQVEVGWSYVRTVLIGMVLFPLGAGLAVVSAMIASIDGATGEQAGLASGINNTAQQVGMALGLAALVAVGDSRTESLVRSGVDAGHAAAAGYATTFAVTAALMAVTAVVALVGTGPGRARRRPAHVVT